MSDLHFLGRGGGEKKKTQQHHPQIPSFLLLSKIKTGLVILCIGHLPYSVEEEYLSKESSVQTEILPARITVNWSTVSLCTVLGWQCFSSRGVPYFHLENVFHTSTCRRSFSQATC